MNGVDGKTKARTGYEHMENTVTCNEVQACARYGHVIHCMGTSVSRADLTEKFGFLAVSGPAGIHCLYRIETVS